MHLYDLAPLLELGRNSLKGENITSWLKERTAWGNQVEDWGVKCKV